MKNILTFLFILLFTVPAFAQPTASFSLNGNDAIFSVEAPLYNYIYACTRLVPGWLTGEATCQGSFGGKSFVRPSMCT